MSATYSSRAKAIISAMRRAFPATSPTGKSNCAIAMRRVVMSVPGKQHVDRRDDREPLARQVRNILSHVAQADGTQLCGQHDPAFASEIQQRHQAADRLALEPRRRRQ